MEPRDPDDRPDDASVYPPAPIPPHERGWRHPSELGAAAWEQSEPPVAIGRGLATATGVLSIVLAVLVLGTLLPTHTGPAASVTRFEEPSAAPTSTSPVTEASTPDPTAPSTPQVTATPPNPTDVVASPVPTYLVTGESTALEAPIAVAIDGGALLVTTATAVAGRITLDLVDHAGQRSTARVVLVDDTSGLALLVGDNLDITPGLTVAAEIAPGDQLRVPGAGNDVLTVDGSSSDVVVALGRYATAVERVAEGAPVVNQRGELVALCTHGSEAPLLVLLDRVQAMRRMLGALVAPTVWLGIVVEVGTTGVRIASLDPLGPAAAAGMRAGDLLVTVDGVDIEGFADLTGVLAARRPGDEIVVTVMRSLEPVQVRIVLGEPPTAL